MLRELVALQPDVIGAHTTPPARAVQQAEAQRKVPRDKLVETVRDILAKHGVRTRTA